jgi:hypothetical protein
VIQVNRISGDPGETVHQVGKAVDSDTNSERIFGDYGNRNDSLRTGRKSDVMWCGVVWCGGAEDHANLPQVLFTVL